MQNVFVYGTLKRGFYNHRILEHANRLGNAVTCEKFTMFSLGPYPMVMPKPKHKIKGEVYEVDDEILERLDRLEGYPDFYTRVETEVIMQNKVINALIYIGASEKCINKHTEVVDNGEWTRR